MKPVAEAIHTVIRFATGLLFYTLGGIGIALSSHPELAVLAACFAALALWGFSRW